jgi:hypothetical protein
VNSRELDATYHELVARLAHIQARRDELAEEENQIKAKLRENLTEGIYMINGRAVLGISTGRRFDPDLAASILPPELISLCQVTVIDSRRAKEILPPLVYAKCQKLSTTPTVRVL